ncbi:hypothetical protein MLP_24910 [Microlunatus phosphovorus NM-1]|uniref:Uncharacterized protein n=1 Tax=Microlunatus phosphovorus (strain ATCC 700054 / DSM 10555 / JCM 9379 / NBRC 101784 / NCIMB 13414 / VKM Ac-1990 / NM-1) TaxID=1032480 RepID=F5XFU8_MICPN|nr:hypothetical protein [Microlunatus phosphovorus]BAK35505.1 hypothetical protein MLP_24910 [Microlunatus phosphovorus NM-1]
MDTSDWTSWALHDPQLGLPVLGLRHPPGWTAQGNVTWVPQHNESPEHHWFQVTDPDQVAMVQGWPRFDFTWPGGAPGQPNGHGRTYLPPDSPDRLLGAVLPQLLGPEAGQPTRFEIYPLPDWAQRLHVGPESITPGVSYTGLYAVADAPTRGTPRRLEILGFHYTVSNQAVFSTITNHGLLVMVLSATMQRYDELRATLYAIMDGTLPNPAWNAAINQVGQTNAAQFAAQQASMRWAAFQAEQAGIAAVGQAAADLRHTQAGNAQAAFNAMMAPPPAATGHAGVSAQEAWRHELGAVTAVEDPNSREGNTRYVSSSTAVTWQNELGEVIETDDVNLDPNINSGTTWKVVRRYGE